MAELMEFLDRHAPRCGPLTVGLVGLGKTNLALLSALRGRKDTRTVLRASERPDADLPCDESYFGCDCYKNIHEDILFLSPTVHREHPELVRAARRGTLLTSDTEVYFEGGREGSHVVTGSDGKSSTTYIASLLLSQEGQQVYPAGNYGRPFCTLPVGAAAVAELSSFNLNYFYPRANSAVITNISENHLNWHTDMAEYIEAKARAVIGAERAALLADCEISRSLLPRLCGFTLFSSRSDGRELLSLGAAHTAVLRGDTVYLDGLPILDTRYMRRSLYYDKINMTAALALTLGEVTAEGAHSAAAEYGGLPHRAELVRMHRGVEFINSSIDTTPSRTAATLEALGRGVHIILGGRGKGLSPSPLFKPLSTYAKSLSLYGEAGEELYPVLLPLGIPTALYRGFDEAVEAASERAAAGDTVLLSPAATAYGEFRDFTERGERFRTLVKKL